MLIGLLLVVQIIISVVMVVVILLQSSKGGGLAGIAGGLSSSAVFGGRSAANFLTKATTVLATLFFLNCLGMAMITSHSGAVGSVTQQAVQQEATTSPVPQIPGGQTVPTTSPEGTAPAGEPAPASVTPVQTEDQPTTSATQPKSTDEGN